MSAKRPLRPAYGRFMNAEHDFREATRDMLCGYCGRVISVGDRYVWDVAPRCNRCCKRKYDVRHHHEAIASGLWVFYEFEGGIDYEMLGLDSLKNLNTHNLRDLDECVAMSVYVVQLIEGYNGFKLDVPDWLEKLKRDLKREMEHRIEDYRRDKIQSLERELTQLDPPEKRRKEVEKKLADMMKGQVTVKMLADKPDKKGE